MSIIPFLEAAEWITKKLLPRKRVLIIEDDPIQLRLFCALMEGRGFIVETAESAEEAVALIKRNHLTVVFVDMRLPYMRGMELLPLIAQLSPRTNVVICCAVLEDIVAGDRLDQVFSVMLKPTTAAKLDELFGKIKT
jgi:DNA-binding NtrC family response regulator